MAITVPTTAPLELIEQIKADIQSHLSDTWVWDAEGDMTLSDPEWHSKAWFRPHVKESKLVFSIIPASEPKMTAKLSAYFHGRLLEFLLLNYPDLASETSTSSIVSKFYDL